MAAPMHDIGKIGIKDSILLKPGKLTHEEFKIMKEHTLIGYEILKDSPSKFLKMGASSHWDIMKNSTVSYHAEGVKRSCPPCLPSCRPTSCSERPTQTRLHCAEYMAKRRGFI
jgi:hypothetical protein